MLPTQIEPLLDYPLRDTSICLAPDGCYYLTGTTGHPTWWTHNEGIHLWRSPDLRHWESLGLVWNAEREGTWPRRYAGSRHAIWAPEIHFIDGTFWLTYSVWGGKPEKAFNGLLKSASGKAAGPYVDAAPHPLATGIDASLFQDGDAVYWIFQNGRIARMNADLSGLAEEPRLLAPSNHHHVGFEGAFVTRIGTRYFLLATEFVGEGEVPVEHFWGMDTRPYDYSCFAASAEHLYGPYGPRHLAIPHAGHNVLFRDKAGQLWSTFFGNGSRAPLRERPAILRVAIDEHGRLAPTAIP